MIKPIRRADAKAEARALLQTAQVSPKAMTALYCGVLLFFSLIGCIVPMPEIVETFLSIFSELLAWVLAAGFALYCMGIRRRERMEFETLFDGFAFPGKIVVLNIVMNLLIGLWSMLFLIPGIIAFYRYRFALYNLYERPELGVMDALALSKRQTQGWKMQLFNLDMSYFGWTLLGLLPSLFFDFQVYLQFFSDPSAVLTGGATLLETAFCGVWSLVVSLFYYPQYQCVALEYFDAAKAALAERPDSL